MSIDQNALSSNWANFLDLADDTKPYLQIPATDTTRDVMLQMVIDAICQYVQNTIGRPITPTQFDRRFDGNQGFTGAYLELPYYPILEIGSVTEYWGVSGPHVLTEQTPTNQVDGFQCDYLRGRLIRVFPGLVQKPWFPGARNIEVRWTAGYNPVPADIKLGCLEIIASWWRNTQQSSRSFRPSGDYDADQVQSEFWGSRLPHMAMPFLSNYLQVGLA